MAIDDRGPRVPQWAGHLFVFFPGQLRITLLGPTGALGRRAISRGGPDGRGLVVISDYIRQLEVTSRVNEAAGHRRVASAISRERSPRRTHPGRSAGAPATEGHLCLHAQIGVA